MPGSSGKDLRYQDLIHVPPSNGIVQARNQAFPKPRLPPSLPAFSLAVRSVVSASKCLGSTVSLPVPLNQQRHLSYEECELDPIIEGDG